MVGFITVVLLIWTALNAYVLWRLSSVPFVAAHLGAWGLWIAGALLWASFPVARFVDRLVPFSVARVLDYAGGTWLGILFLLFACLLAADILTGFGWLFPTLAPKARGLAALAALALSAFGLVQGCRDPEVTEHEITLQGLPRELDGTTLVVLTDLHLGTVLSAPWLEDVRRRVEDLRPDLLLLVGDVLDGNVRRAEPSAGVLRRLSAPLGVYAVTGNHEFYAGLERSVAMLREAGIHVLRDEAVAVAPGLVLAGVDDLTARRQFGMDGDPVPETLLDRPAGATILLSHSPLDAEKAAVAGAGLMLSGHTHAGQIWPFRYVSAISYPRVSGRYDVDGMPLLVCRGTGTWGPRMRIFRRSEILRIVLRAESPHPAGR